MTKWPVESSSSNSSSSNSNSSNSCLISTGSPKARDRAAAARMARAAAKMAAEFEKTCMQKSSAENKFNEFKEWQHASDKANINEQMQPSLTYLTNDQNTNTRIRYITIWFFA